MKYAKYALFIAMLITLGVLLGSVASATLAPGVNGADMTPDLPGDSSALADDTASGDISGEVSGDLPASPDADGNVSGDTAEDGSQSSSSASDSGMTGDSPDSSEVPGSTVGDSGSSAEESSGGIGVWGVIIAILIVAAIVLLIFAFMPRR